jgi:hypothetical protein
MMTRDLRGWPVFACQVRVDDALTKGTHIGRVAVGSSGFDRCVVQYFDRPPILQEQFDVLVQNAPPLRP